MESMHTYGGSDVEALLSRPAYDLYVSLLAGQTRSIDPECLTHLERELVELGFVTVTPARQPTTRVGGYHLTAAAPFVAAHQVVAEHAARLASWERQATNLISRLTELHTNGPADLLDDTVDVQLLTDQRAVSALTNQIVESARSELLELNTISMASSSTGVSSVHEAAVDVKVICETVVLEDGSASALDARVAAGQIVRTFPKLPATIRIADRDRAVVAIDDAEQRVCLYVGTSRLVGSIVALFKTLWAQAVPYGRSGPTGTILTERERDVLQLVAAGLKDEAVARHLGLAVRTVRRHITAIMDKLQADTRFAAGVLACSRGWIAPP